MTTLRKGTTKSSKDFKAEVTWTSLHHLHKITTDYLCEMVLQVENEGAMVFFSLSVNQMSMPVIHIGKHPLGKLSVPETEVVV